jgi:hypothetical protein
MDKFFIELPGIYLPEININNIFIIQEIYIPSEIITISQIYFLEKKEDYLEEEKEDYLKEVNIDFKKYINFVENEINEYQNQRINIFSRSKIIKNYFFTPTRNIVKNGFTFDHINNK